MARNNQIVRTLMVARELAASRRGVSLKALAEKHDWNWRTLYRDVEALQAAGFPVVKEDGRYTLVAGWNAPAGPGVDDEELLALYSLRALSGSIRGTRMGRAVERLWMKLASSGSGQGSLVPLQTPAWFSVRSPMAIDYRPHEATIAVFERAIRDHLAVDCVYRAISTKTEVARTIEPAELYWDPGLESLYVLAYCRLREDVRVFAVHRFQMATLTEQRFVPNAGARSTAILKNVFRLWRSKTVETVRIRFTADVAEEIRERKWGPGQAIEALPGGAVILTLQVAGTAEVLRWVLGYGGGAVVLEPAGLVTRVQEALRAAAAAYGREGEEGRRGPQRLSPADNVRVHGGGRGRRG